MGESDPGAKKVVIRTRSDRKSQSVIEVSPADLTRKVRVPKNYGARRKIGNSSGRPTTVKWSNITMTL